MKKPGCYGQCLLIQDDETDLFNLIKVKIFEARHNYVAQLMSDPEFMFKFSYSAQQNRLEPHLLVPTYFPLKQTNRLRKRMYCYFIVSLKWMVILIY